MNNDFDDIFNDVGNQYGIDPQLLKAHAYYESGLDPNFKNPDSTASGLGAFTDAAAKDYGVDRTDPRSSIEGQAKCLKANYDKFQNSPDPVSAALSAYKTGPNSNTIDQHYVNGVMSVYNDLRGNQAPRPLGTGASPQSDSDKAIARLQAYAPPTSDTEPSVSPDLGYKGDIPSITVRPTDQLVQQGTPQSPSDKAIARLQAYAQQSGSSPTSVDTSPQGTYNTALANARNSISGASAGLPGVEDTQGLPASELAYAANAISSIPGLHEAGSAIAAGLGSGQGDTFGDRYNNLEQSQQAMRQAGAESNPGATAMGQVGTALVTTPLLPAFEGGATLPGKVLAGTGTGAGYGAGYGLGQGDASKSTAGSIGTRIGNAGESGALGGAFGAAVPAALSAGQGIANALTRTATPDVENAANAIHSIVGSPLTNLDTTEYVPGSKPTLAQAAAYGGDSNAGNAAALEKTMSESNVGGSDLYNQGFADRASANKQARRNNVLDLTKTPDDLEKARDVRSAIGTNMLERKSGQTQPIWDDPQATPANPQSVVDTIDNILKGPDRGNDAVTQVLGNLKNKIVKADGSLETDPEYLYKSVIKTINTWQGKNPPTDNLSQLAKGAVPQVNDVKNALQEVINQAVPKYGDYLAAYKAASRPIDQMKALQGLGLINPESDASSPTLAKVNQSLKKIADQRSAPGINPFKQLDPDQINKLRGLQSDLEREQSAQNMLQTKGSPTSQNLQFVNKVKSSLGASKPVWPRTVGGAIGGTLSGATSNLLGGGPIADTVAATAGSAAGERLGDVVASKIAAKGSKNAQNVGNLLLNPNDYSALQTTKSSLANKANPFNSSGPVGKFFAGTNYGPAVGYGANKLLQLANPSNP